MNETIDLDDMRLFARVFLDAETDSGASMAAAARALGLPKQTVSRRVAHLERALGVELVRRSGRSLRLTAVGAAYAQRCAEIARLADDANRDLVDSARSVRGVLRVTADPVFGDAFLGPLLSEYASRFPDVKLDVVLTREKVDLTRHRFDVAFRVGAPVDPELRGVRLGAARVCFCASPEWMGRQREAVGPSSIAGVDALVVADGEANVRWPVPFDDGLRPVVVRVRHRFSSLGLALHAARAGLGVGLFPEFVCAPHLRARSLVDVLGRPVDVGAVWLLHASRRSARVSAFVGLARKHFANAPWAASSIDQEPAARRSS